MIDKKRHMMFTKEQQLWLLQLAREAVYTAVVHRRVTESGDIDAAYRTTLGVFVTLTKHGELRGCIGFPEPVYPLHEAIIRGGIAAALHDTRFAPVLPSEVADLAIEISVLSPLAPILPQDIVVGTHGLVVEQGHARGLLLPQVPVEWGWNREEFLAHTCRKAGLPADAWQTGATLYAFTAEVFSEEELAREGQEELSEP
jgi:AmmeMemoRadiSam system protein A